MDTSSTGTNQDFVSIKQFVQFKDIKQEYVQGEPLKCSYVLNNYRSEEGDRVAIYKVGWTNVKQYIAFEWAPVDNVDENYVTFNKYSLAKTLTDLYQICYISCHNETYGVSPPFQFVKNKLHVSYDSLKTSFDSAFSSNDIERDVAELRTENRVCREKMKALMSIVVNMQSFMHQQQNEIDYLKNKVESVVDSKCACSHLHIKKDYDMDSDELPPFPPFPAL